MSIIDTFKKFFGKGIEGGLNTFTKPPKNISDLIKSLAEKAKQLSKMKLPKK